MFSLSGERSSSNSPDFSVFTHRLGHGIGLEGHEDPYLVQGPLGETKAQPGHVFSLEPGVYIPAVKEGRELKGDSSGISGVGVRLEDCFVITVDEEGRLGGEWLTGPVHAWGEV
jgi:Xaa-Pro aminopeptidase